MDGNRTKMNYYEILEVDQTAAQQDIQRAYVRAKSTYAHDNPALYGMFSREEARELLKLIEEAYTILSNPTARRTYDESLHRLTSAAANSPMFNAPRSDGLLRTAPSPPPQEGRALANYLLSDDMQQDFVVQTRPSNATPQAAGLGKTPLSTYTIDEKFERELVDVTEYDGALLQKIRTYKNISIDALTESSRIGRTYLMALETNDYRSLPAPVFVRGFLVQLAKLYGLDPHKVSTTYLKKMKTGGS